MGKGNAALDGAEAPIAVAEAAEDAAPGGIALLHALDWELVVLKEHVVHVHHLAEDHGLLRRGQKLLPTLLHGEVVGIGARATSSAPAGAVVRRLLGDGRKGAFLTLALILVDVEVGLHAEILAATEAHGALNDAHTRLNGRCASLAVLAVGRDVLRQDSRGDAGEELHSGGAATATNRDNGTVEDSIVRKLASFRAVVDISHVASMHAHLVTAAGAAHPAVCKPVAQPKALKGGESHLSLVPRGVSRLVTGRATAITRGRHLRIVRHVELDERRVIRAAAGAAPAVPRAAGAIILVGVEERPRRRFIVAALQAFWGEGRGSETRWATTAP